MKSQIQIDMDEIEKNLRESLGYDDNKCPEHGCYLNFNRQCHSCVLRTKGIDVTVNVPKKREVYCSGCGKWFKRFWSEDEVYWCSDCYDKKHPLLTHDDFLNELND